MERRSTIRLNRTSQTLGLWMNGAYVGTWSLGANAPDTLQYDADWTRSEQGRPLSLSLPFMPGNLPHRGPHVRAWFENLLPDSKDIRERMARRYRAGSTDAFDLVAADVDPLLFAVEVADLCAGMDLRRSGHDPMATGPACRP